MPIGLLSAFAVDTTRPRARSRLPFFWLGRRVEVSQLAEFLLLKPILALPLCGHTSICDHFELIRVTWIWLTKYRALQWLLWKFSWVAISGNRKQFILTSVLERSSYWYVYERVDSHANNLSNWKFHFWRVILHSVESRVVFVLWRTFRGIWHFILT